MKKALVVLLAVIMIVSILSSCSATPAQSSSGLRILSETLAPEQYAVGFRKGDASFCNEVEKQLAAMQSDGTFKNISMQWFGKDVSMSSQATASTASAAATDTSLADIKKKGSFTLGLDDSFPPMGFKDDKGNIVGFDIDLAKEVAKRMGVELKIQPIDWTAKEMELNNKNIDVIWNGLSITPDRQQSMLLSTPYMENKQIVVVKNDSSVQKLADLKGKQVAVQDGSSAQDALKAADPDLLASIKQVDFKDNVAALMDLKNGNVDAVAMDSVVAEYYINKNLNTK